jgi:hypothetical protein
MTGPECTERGGGGGEGGLNATGQKGISLHRWGDKQKYVCGYIRQRLRHFTWVKTDTAIRTRQTGLPEALSVLFTVSDCGDLEFGLRQVPRILCIRVIFACICKIILSGN